MTNYDPRRPPTGTPTGFGAGWLIIILIILVIIGFGWGGWYGGWYGGGGRTVANAPAHNVSSTTGAGNATARNPHTAAAPAPNAGSTAK